MPPIPTHISLAQGLIEAFEGYSSTPYQDSSGIWTIGYGFTGPKITRNSPPMAKEAGLLELAKRLVDYDRMLGLELFAAVSEHQRGALLSLGWNIGMGRLGRSTLLAYVNDNAFGAAAAQFSVFTHDRNGVSLPGLVRRRAAEQAMFQQADELQPLDAP